MADLENGGEHVKAVQISFQVGPEAAKMLAQACKHICTRAGSRILTPLTFSFLY